MHVPRSLDLKPGGVAQACCTSVIHESRRSFATDANSVQTHLTQAYAITDGASDTIPAIMAPRPAVLLAPIMHACGLNTAIDTKLSPSYMLICELQWSWRKMKQISHMIVLCAVQG